MLPLAGIADLWRCCRASLLAQRVVDPDAPWKLEKPGMSLSQEFGIVPLAPGPPIKSGEFVRRTGSVLTLGGNPYRFNGNNLYYNQADIVYGRQAGVEETLDKMAALGMTVVRSTPTTITCSRAIRQPSNCSRESMWNRAW